MIKIEHYNSSSRKEWNEFVNRSRNGTFLFNRDYVEYHRDRFSDASLVLYDKGSIVALFIANSSENFIVSHGGLTYGGLIYGISCGTKKVVDLIGKIVDYYSMEGYSKIIYKAIPYIYPKFPSGEDLYALFRNNFVLKRRDVSVSIDLRTDFRFSGSRNRAIRKALRNNPDITVRETDDFRTYWEILSKNLMSRYGRSPTHSVDEIVLLKNLFPQNIHLYASFLNDEMLSGVIVYEVNSVAHLQYIASSDRGRQTGALDLVISELIKMYKRRGFNFFDFGISTEKDGKYLNENLIFYKESFGATAICYDWWELTMK
ncbi:MAG: GNAT family N-acetyltransferase [Conexivisphaerales archaeon]